MKVIFLIIIVSCIFPLSVSADQNVLLLRFGSGTKSEPFTHIDNNIVTGIYQEILYKALAPMGYEIEMHTYPPARVINAFEQGLIDLFPHLEVGDLVRFQNVPNSVVCPEILFSTKISLFVDRARSLDMKSGTPVTVGWLRYHRASSELLRQYFPGDVRFTYFNSYKPLVKSLVAGRIDAVVSSSPNFHANEKMLRVSVPIQEDNIFPSAKVRLGFSRLTLGDKAEFLSQEFCRRFVQMRKDGVIDKIISKYSDPSYFEYL